MYKQNKREVAAMITNLTYSPIRSIKVKMAYQRNTSVFENISSEHGLSSYVDKRLTKNNISLFP